MKKFNLTLTIPCAISCDSHEDIVLSQMKTIANSHYQNGRHPLDREMFALGLEGILKQAVHKAISEKMDELHGRFTMRNIGENTKMNLSLLKTCEWMKNELHGIYIYQDNWKAEIS